MSDDHPDDRPSAERMAQIFSTLAEVRPEMPSMTPKRLDYRIHGQHGRVDAEWFESDGERRVWVHSRQTSVEEGFTLTADEAAGLAEFLAAPPEADGDE